VFEPLRQHVQFLETLLIHQIAPDRPDISSAVGSCDLAADSEDSEESDDSTTSEGSRSTQVLGQERRPSG
jgi:hypothetical protein